MKRLSGILVVNHFLNAVKYQELYEKFLDAAKEYSIDLVMKTNADLLMDMEALKENAGKVDFVLFWDKDIRLAQLMESFGYRLFNNSKAVEICDDKSYTYLKLLETGISMPKTIFSPKTFGTVKYAKTDFVAQLEQQLDYPMVVKECYGSFGMQVYLVKNRKELLAKLEETAPEPLIFQEFIEESAGRDVRIQVIGDEVVASMYRYSDSEDFRANLSIGGKMKAYTPSQEEMDIAVACCKAIGLDFAGVDLLFGKDGKVLVCEVNSNAHFKNIYDCTKVNAASLILEHIKNRLAKEQ